MKKLTGSLLVFASVFSTTVAVRSAHAQVDGVVFYDNSSVDTYSLQEALNKIEEAKTSLFRGEHARARQKLALVRGLLARSGYDQRIQRAQMLVEQALQVIVSPIPAHQKETRISNLLQRASQNIMIALSSSGGGYDDGDDYDDGSDYPYPDDSGGVIPVFPGDGGGHGGGGHGGGSYLNSGDRCAYRHNSNVGQAECHLCPRGATGWINFRENRYLRQCL